MSGLDFTDLFREITGHEPRDYQVRLAERLAQGEPPSHLSVPTGMGKTLAVLIGWLYALAQDAEQVSRRRRRRVVPLRLHLVVDRRAVVDDSFEAAQRIRKALAEGAGDRSAVRHVVEVLRSAFAIPAGAEVLEVRRLRGGLADADGDLTEHTRYPSRPAIIVGTLDMTVSRLLFRGYQLSPYRRSIDAALTGMDAFWVLDEAHLSEQAAELSRPGVRDGHDVVGPGDGDGPPILRAGVDPHRFERGAGARQGGPGHVVGDGFGQFDQNGDEEGLAGMRVPRPADPAAARRLIVGDHGGSGRDGSLPPEFGEVVLGGSGQFGVEDDGGRVSGEGEPRTSDVADALGLRSGQRQLPSVPLDGHVVAASGRRILPTRK